jgi:predicted TIM-barrel fold metal-dependent hydrolase
VWRFEAVLAIAISSAAALGAQTMSIEDYEPKSTLVVPEHHPQRAKYPFIDVHNHQERDQTAEEVRKLVADMDSLNIRVMVNLSGDQGAEFDKGYRNLKRRYPNRFVIFANVDFDGIGTPGWTKAVAQLERDIQHGAQGLEDLQEPGADGEGHVGQGVPVDDPRLDPIWAKCGARDPRCSSTSAERALLRSEGPAQRTVVGAETVSERARPPDRYPPWETIIGEQQRMFARHPQTRFIDAHLGWLGGDLARLGALFDRLPNVYTEIGAVLAELGRQPRFARAWFIKYQDRIMFGKDIWEPSEYLVYFRVLKRTTNFDYYRKRHAFWKIG